MKASEISTLIKRIKEGDTQTLSLIVEECKKLCIANLLKKTSCSKDQAEEIFIEAVMNFRDRVMEGKLENVMNLKSYMAGTCYNMWLNEYRQQRKEQSNVPYLQQYYQQQLDSYGVEEENENLEAMMAVTEKGMGALDQNCRKIISYFYIENKGMEEIAQLMGLANAKVAKSTKYRCFKKLMGKVQEMTNSLATKKS